MATEVGKTYARVLTENAALRERVRAMQEALGLASDLAQISYNQATLTFNGATLAAQAAQQRVHELLRWIEIAAQVDPAPTTETDPEQPQT